MPGGTDQEAEGGDLLYPIPTDLTPTTTVRGTILALDQRWLRSQNLFDAYVTALGPDSALSLPSAIDWLPFPHALAHWRALDAPGVSSPTAFEAGRFVGTHIHGSILRTLAQLAGKMGFTPWTALANCHKFWRRSWQGGGVVVRRQGEAMARLDLVNTSVARSRFFRSSLMGTIAVGLEPFCKRVVVVERDDNKRTTDVSLRIAWQ